MGSSNPAVSVSDFENYGPNMPMTGLLGRTSLEHGPSLGEVDSLSVPFCSTGVDTILQEFLESGSGYSIHSVVHSRASSALVQQYAFLAVRSTFNSDDFCSEEETTSCKMQAIQYTFHLFNHPEKSFFEEINSSFGLENAVRTAPLTSSMS
eukprot:scaffold6784_cov108-Cylindrotheca_fusiformis.AAC.10